MGNRERREGWWVKGNATGGGGGGEQTDVRGWGVGLRGSRGRGGLRGLGVARGGWGWLTGGVRVARGGVGVAHGRVGVGRGGGLWLAVGWVSEKKRRVGWGKREEKRVRKKKEGRGGVSREGRKRNEILCRWRFDLRECENSKSFPMNPNNSQCVLQLPSAVGFPESFPPALDPWVGRVEEVIADGKASKVVVKGKTTDPIKVTFPAPEFALLKRRAISKTLLVEPIKAKFMFGMSPREKERGVRECVVCADAGVSPYSGFTGHIEKLTHEYGRIEMNTAHIHELSPNIARISQNELNTARIEINTGRIDGVDPLLHEKLQNIKENPMEST
ncbi:hypothetical protein Fmac_008809 [Flemingia macrophylla]|uniref:Uncharacterized protein n=1 Tax=Flemingia macrophylla TaxID=520843 RepID=A0ABD1MYH5_9FABA